MILLAKIVFYNEKPLRSDRTITAKFREQNKYHIEVINSENGDIYPLRDLYIDKGEVVEFNAVPYQGFKFICWQVVTGQGSFQGETNHFSPFVADSDCKVQAIFSKIENPSDNLIINSINITCKHLRSNIIEITFSSTYPLKSDVVVTYSARGNYVCQDPTYNGGEQERPDEGTFDTELTDGRIETILNADNSKWVFYIYAFCPGSTDVADLTGTVGWSVQTSSDNTYKYIKGSGINTF